jgi:hypothetical protein
MPMSDWVPTRHPNEIDRLVLLTSWSREKEYHYSMVDSIALREDLM